MNLSETIHLLKKDIIHLSMDCARKLAHFHSSENENVISDKDYGAIICEFQYLFIHIIDRFADKILSGDESDIFMEALGIAVINANIDKASKDMDKKAKRDAESEEINILNERNAKYAVYKKLFPDINEKPKNTLFWEFGKNITSEYLHSNNPAIVVYCASLAADIFKEIKIEELIKNITFYPKNSSN